MIFIDFQNHAPCAIQGAVEEHKQMREPECTDLNLSLGGNRLIYLLSSDISLLITRKLHGEIANELC